MTNQELFDIVVAHARKQNKRAIANEVCSYRTPEGLKCFAGALIKDEFYIPEMERLTCGTGGAARTKAERGRIAPADLVYKLQRTSIAISYPSGPPSLPSSQRRKGWSMKTLLLDCDGVILNPLVLHRTVQKLLLATSPAARVVEVVRFHDAMELTRSEWEFVTKTLVRRDKLGHLFSTTRKLKVSSSIWDSRTRSCSLNRALAGTRTLG
jgi:hypothetical protein